MYYGLFLYHQKAQLPQAVPLIVSPSPAAVPQCELDVELRRMHALEHACNGRNGPCCLSNEDNLVREGTSTIIKSEQGNARDVPSLSMLLLVLLIDRYHW